jgi:hypothetical protein
MSVTISTAIDSVTRLMCASRSPSDCNLVRACMFN